MTGKGEVAYNAYKEALCEALPMESKFLKPWRDIAEERKAAWEQAALSVCESLLHDMRMGSSTTDP